MSLRNSKKMIQSNKKAEPEHQVHTIAPFYDRDSRILILGSFPSVKSREARFFYGHPRNRFWKVMSAVFDWKEPSDTEEKKAFLRANHIAVWDTIASCTITGSSDSSIRDVVPNDIRPILEEADIREIYCNGNTSFGYYRKYIEPVIKRNAVRLPSTSPANAGWSLERLIEAWRVCREAAEAEM